MIQTLAALEELNLSLSDVKSKIDYKPQVLESLEVKDMEIIGTSEFKKNIESIKKNYSDSRISIRKSGTEAKIRIMVESNSEKNIPIIINLIKELIS